MLSSARHVTTDRRGLRITEKIQVKIRDTEPRQLADWADLRQFDRVAIVRGRGLGDLVMLIPTLRALRFFCPDTEFYLFCDPQYVSLFYAGPVPAASISDLDRGCYDAIIQLGTFVERSPDAWTVDRISLFGRAFGISIWDGVPLLHRDPAGVLEACDLLEELHIEVGAPFVLIGPDASDPCRALPNGLVDGLCRECSAAGMVPVVVGLGRGHQVSVATLVSLVAESAAVVSGDNALYHIAGAFPYMTKSFPVFTTVPPNLRACWYKNCFPAVPAVPCAPCREARALPDGSPCSSACMDAIDAKAIMERIKLEVL